MSKLTLDPELKAKLNGLDEQVEIYDETGAILGRFLPESIYREMIYSIAEAERPGLPPDEETRRRNQTTGRTLAEIMAELERS